MLTDIDELSGVVVDAAFQLHRDLGPGLLESVYEAVLAAKLERLGLLAVRQKPVDITYDGIHFPAAFRIDLIVDDRLLIEIKSVERLNAAHSKQLLTYLRLTLQPVGLIINFGAATFKEGVHRIVNEHRPSATSRLRVNRITEF